jgi:1-acyl-sn-glycerol-3-phosphate acyltransferase
MPYFLDEADYRRIDSLLSRDTIAGMLEKDRELLVSPIGMTLKQNILSDPLHLTPPLLSKLQGFQVSDAFRLYQDHIFTDDRQALLFIECTMPVSETARNAELIDSLKLFIGRIEQHFGGQVSLHSFGASEISLNNATQIKKDTILSSALAVFLIFLLLVYFFRSGKKILLIFLSVLFGGLFALAFLYLIRGEVSVIAIGISSIMFGIAINYPLHFVDHYSHTPNPRLVIKDIFEPLTIGNITTVGAFLSLVFIGSNAMCDLGWFASLLLVGAIFFVLLFLPHLLPVRKTNREQEHTLFTRIIGKPFENNRWIVTAVLLLTVFLSFFSMDSRFETDMQKINYMTKEQEQEYRRMTGLLNKNQHILYYVTEGDNLDKALEENEKLTPLMDTLLAGGRIHKTGGIGHFFPSRARQAERVQQWNTFWSSRKDSVQTCLNEASQHAGFKPGVFQAFETMINRTWEVPDSAHFDVLKEVLVKNFIIETDDKTMVVNMLYMDAGRAAALEEELNSLDNASISFDAGSITRRMVASLSDNFNYVLYICGFIVFVFLFFSMGRLELSLIAFVPLALSWIWILGLMNIFDIRFNIVNIILATFIFGQGDDYTIFKTEGLMYEYTFKKKMLASYKNSIALSALIMFIGMGMLIFAKHPALRSLAEVTIVGMLSVVVMAYILPPFLFNLLTIRKGKKRMMPVTLRNLFATAYSFAVFLTVSTFITITGWVMFTFGKTTEKKKRVYHTMLCRVAKFVIYRVPGVKTTLRNLSGETFEKPSVIICNHQAHLDLMCVMMLTPKLIVLTNDWVWHSPFYGRMIKYAEFYPVSSGIETAHGLMEDVIRRGYSIVFFPEGTRSPDCSIRRFHSGAFFLAEKLGLDIVPVMIHGVGHVLPKQEFMLRKGHIYVQVMERITPADPRFDSGYSTRCHQVRRYYKEEYQALCRQFETAGYYSDLVLHNYIYKGPTIERAIRKSLRKQQHFAELIARFPDEGRALIINSGYGEFTLLLALVKKRLQVVGVEPDADLRNLAANCASVPPNLQYIENEQTFGNEPADVRIIRVD